MTQEQYIWIPAKPELAPSQNFTCKLKNVGILSNIAFIVKSLLWAKGVRFIKPMILLLLTTISWATAT